MDRMGGFKWEGEGVSKILDGRFGHIRTSKYQLVFL